jgi:hypothetical protein
VNLSNPVGLLLSYEGAMSFAAWVCGSTMEAQRSRTKAKRDQNLQHINCQVRDAMVIN